MKPLPVREERMDLKLTGKTAIVTGASKGIGLAIVQALAAEGVRVVGAARTINQPLREATPLVFPVDLATPDGPSQLVEHSLTELGGIDVLVNNVASGQVRSRGFLEIEDSEWQRSLDGTLFSTVRATRAALPSLIERRGCIVNIGSINSRLGVPHLVDYGAAKAALINLSKSLAEEFGPKGVRVNTISPGPVSTSIWTEPGRTGDMLAAMANMPLSEFITKFPSMAGLSTGCMADPEEVAALVVVLVSGCVPNMNGSDVVIDSGMLKTV
ncbi:MAG: SDR family NAD(P)-dependent oxidoreductase [Pseudonocardiaceae bacterium]